MNATTTIPTSAPMSSVRTEKPVPRDSGERRPTAATKNPTNFSVRVLGPRSILFREVQSLRLFPALLGRSAGLFLPRRQTAVFQQIADGIHKSVAAGAQLADAVARDMI